MKKRQCYTISAVFAALFLLMIVLVKFVDVSAIGPNDSAIGLSHINKAVHELFGTNLFWYNLTQVFGVVALLVCIYFALIGLMQLIQRKSLSKVDHDILCLGLIYIITILLYVIFEKVVINYRPMIMEGETELEASFPSSHTMLVTTVMSTAAIYWNGHIKKNVSLQNALVNISLIIVVLTVVGRLICGVHWFSDILAGLFISLSLIFLYRALTYRPKKRKKRKVSY